MKVRNFTVELAPLKVAMQAAMVDAFFKIAQWIAVAIVIFSLLNLTPLLRDPTDQSGWFGARSGMAFRVDYGTGCQYLEGAGGGLSPRLDVEGHHLGCLPYDDEEPALDMSLRLQPLD